MSEIKIYNKTKVYEKELAPLIAEIRKICRINDIPFIYCFATANNETKTKYEVDGVGAIPLGFELTDDRFTTFDAVFNSPHTLVLRGAESLDKAQEDYINQTFDDDYDDEMIPVSDNELKNESIIVQKDEPGDEPPAAAFNFD